MRDDPSLRDKPLAVGGRPEQRGVVATCNYEARKYGVRSAMSTAQALRRCPDLVMLPPAMEKYRIASRQILSIYRDYTELVEPLSLDEAYLDVTEASSLHGSATAIAQEIRARIFETVGITASAGIAPNKFIAKIASDWNKPNGQFVVKPQQMDAFVSVLPVARLFGVGKVTAAHMNRLGVQTCGDLRTWSLHALMQEFGSFGERLHDLCRGIDERPVNPSRERKSVSVEETYAIDLPDLAACRREMAELLVRLDERIRRARAEGDIGKLFVKLRFDDFTRTTAECVATAVEAETVDQLLETGFGRRRRAVRLLGVGIRLAARSGGDQLHLFGET
ncbi:DNA polymerase IV [Oxalicibacterium solurbis]|uniref:DNA polymerase IV n=2 Tax=Oxalicibacterium solurbis TaxID=69280 RepID=A0A8J3AWW7_9BURK|nr:DNA polymerase IV [Oxalicibacterium solurbis]